MTHWAIPYIGRPWVFGAEGPESFDCWGFVRFVQREHFAISMPVIGYAQDWRETAHLLKEHEEFGHWNRVDVPEEGDVVLMARSRLPIHIGVWIKANQTEGVLHCLQGAGVLFQPGKALSSSGWGCLQFYRHKSKCTS